MSDLVRLDEVFDILHGNSLDLNKMIKRRMDDDAVAFVGRSRERNGITAFVAEILGIEPFEAGLITVALGGSALASFVQPRPFYTAQNIDVLAPLTPMDLDTKLFYCLCIGENRFRYSTFGREANRTLRTLLVPTVESAPEWVRGTGEKVVNELHSELTRLVLLEKEPRESSGLEKTADLMTKLLRVRPEDIKG